MGKPSTGDRRRGRPLIAICLDPKKSQDPPTKHAPKMMVVDMRMRKKKLVVENIIKYR
jgi:hypothetical protein